MPTDDEFKVRLQHGTGVVYPDGTEVFVPLVDEETRHRWESDAYGDGEPLTLDKLRECLEAQR